MHLTFWQPIPSPHQRGLLEALASAPWVKSVRLRYESPLSDERRAQGWEDAEFVGVDVARIATGEVPRSGADQVNIFTGFLTHPDVWGAFKRIPSGAPGLCLAYAEAPDLRGFAGLGRKIKYRLTAWRLGKRLHGGLALGELGADFYRSILGSKVPVFTFGYYDRRNDNSVTVAGSASDPGIEPGSLRAHRYEDGGSATVPDSLGVGSHLAGDRARSDSLDDNSGAAVPDGGLSDPSGLPSAPSGLRSQVSGLPSAQSDPCSDPSGLKSQVSGLPSAPSGLPSAPSGLSPQVSGLSSEPSLATYVAPVPPHAAPMLGKIGALQPTTRRLLFVGQCIWRKGLDQLLVALASLPPSAPAWVLDVVGVGPESYLFMQLAERLDLVDRVRFRGVQRGDALDRLYEKAHLVVVPSRWDGWGMAVNEALFAGVPVAATDRCGAVSVIENLQRCLVLPSQDTKAWPELLSEWLEWGPASEAERASLKSASLRLTGEAGAELLRKIIEQARKTSNYPLAPSN